MYNLSKDDTHVFMKDFRQINGHLMASPQTDETCTSLAQKIVAVTLTKENAMLQVKWWLRIIDSFQSLSFTYLEHTTQAGLLER